MLPSSRVYHRRHSEHKKTSRGLRDGESPTSTPVSDHTAPHYDDESSFARRVRSCRRRNRTWPLLQKSSRHRTMKNLDANFIIVLYLFAIMTGDSLHLRDRSFVTSPVPVVVSAFRPAFNLGRLKKAFPTQPQFSPGFGLQRTYSYRCAWTRRAAIDRGEDNEFAGKDGSILPQSGSSGQKDKNVTGEFESDAVGNGGGSTRSTCSVEPDSTSRNDDEELNAHIDSFLRGEYDTPLNKDLSNSPAPDPELAPNEAVELALQALRTMDEPEGAAVLLRFCTPLSRAERWGIASPKEPWKEVLRGAITPTMLARRIRASDFSGLLDWKRLSITEGYSTTEKPSSAVLALTVAFVNAALFFDEGSEPAMIQFTLKKIGGVWLIDNAVISKKEWFVDSNDESSS